MANVEKYAKWVLKWEGGYVNDPADAGGETNKGITIKTWKAAGYDISEKISEVTTKSGRRYKNVTKSLYEMTDAQFIKILKEKYWDKWQADTIKSQSVAEMLVQWVWGSGTTGIKEAQKVLGVKSDGVVGQDTLNAVNSRDPKELWETLKKAREQFFRNLVAKKPQNEKFLKGWLNRLNDMKFEKEVKEESNESNSNNTKPTENSEEESNIPDSNETGIEENDEKKSRFLLWLNILIEFLKTLFKIKKS